LGTGKGVRVGAAAVLVVEVSEMAEVLGESMGRMGRLKGRAWWLIR
jgi:hypothetical protein